MSEEYTAKVFKSGNSVALRLPKALGLKEGDVMRLSSKDGNLVAEPIAGGEERIDLDGIYASVPGIRRPPCEENPRDWYVAPRNG